MFYLVDKTEDLTLGHNIQITVRDCSEAARREPGYAGALQQRPGGWNIKR